MIYSDRYGIEERGVVLTVNPNDGHGCKFQADGMYNNSQTVAASDLILKQADRVRI